MRSVDLPDYNVVLTKPDEMTDEQCSPLTAWRGTTQAGDACFITAWVPNKEDLEALNAGRPLYLMVVNTSFAPVSLYTLDEKNEINE